jgi:DNA-binding Lrp family transcriptional regulator
MADFIPVSEEGINPIEYVSPNFSDLSESDITSLLGSILILKEVNIKLLQSILQLKKIQVEEQCGRLSNSDFLDIEFTRNSVKLLKINKPILKLQSPPNRDDKSILAYLKARFVVSIEELQKSFSLSHASVIVLLSKFVVKGIISLAQVEGDKFNVIVYHSLPKRIATQITTNEKKIVGYSILYPNANINEIANDLDLPEHEVQDTIVNLILSDLIFCEFNVKYGFLKNLEIEIKIERFQINFTKRDIDLMSIIERKIIGFVTLRRKISLNDIAKFVKIRVSEVLEIISTLTATQEFEFKLNPQGLISPITVPVYSMNKTIEDLDKTSIIDYKILAGIILSKKEFNLSDIADRLKLDENKVLGGIIDLYLGGIISGKLITPNRFKITSKRESAITEQGTLDRWEKIIIGCLLAEGKISIIRLASLLGTDKDEARNKAYIFLSRGFAEIEIKNAFISLKSKPILPPLMHIIDMPTEDQQLLGYLIAMKSTPLKKIRQIFDITSTEALRRAYTLAGSGLVSLKNNSGKLEITRDPQSKPTLEEDELSYQSRMVILELRSFKKEKIRFSKIANKLDWSTSDIIREIALLIAQGYYKGYFTGSSFIKQSDFIRPRDKPRCFECDTLLKNYKKPCTSCLTRPPLCSVCRSVMNTSEDLVKCKFCNSRAHRDHMTGWLKIKQICPICRNNLRLSDLITVEFNF